MKGMSSSVSSKPDPPAAGPEPALAGNQLVRDVALCIGNAMARQWAYQDGLVNAAGFDAAGQLLQLDWIKGFARVGWAGYDAAQGQAVK